MDLRNSKISDFEDSAATLQQMKITTQNVEVLNLKVGYSSAKRDPTNNDKLLMGGLSQEGEESKRDDDAEDGAAYKWEEKSKIISS